jgi:sulfite exporter TauE/SafE
MDLRGGMTLLGGCFMICMGLVILKILPLPGFLSAPLTFHGARWGRLFPPLFQSNRLASKLALGLLTGFLPCGLSWAMIGKAATTQNIPGGFLTMVAFGLGTVPLLFFTGVSASLLSMKTRLVGERIAGLAVIVMGLILVFKGGRIFV